MISERERIAKELDQFLLIRGIHWQLLPEEDLKKLYEAFIHLRDDVMAVFDLLETAPVVLPEGKAEWRRYTA